MIEAKMYVITGTGEGVACDVVTDLREGLHTFMCLCGKSLEQCSENENTEVSHVLEEMESSNDWSFDECGRRFQYSFEGYCYGITVTALYHCPKVFQLNDPTNLAALIVAGYIVLAIVLAATRKAAAACTPEPAAPGSDPAAGHAGISVGSE